VRSNNNSRQGSFSLNSAGGNSGMGMLRSVQRRPTFKGMASIGNRFRPVGRDAFTQTEAFAGYKPLAGGPLAAMHESMQSKKSSTELKTLQTVIDTLTAELAEMAQKVDMSEQTAELTLQLDEAQKKISEQSTDIKSLNNKIIELTNRIVIFEERTDDEAQKINNSVQSFVDRLAVVKITADPFRAASAPPGSSNNSVASIKSSSRGNPNDGTGSSRAGAGQDTSRSIKEEIEEEAESGDNLISSMRTLSEKFNARNRKRSRLTVSDYISSLSTTLLHTLEVGINTRNELLQRQSFDKLQRDRKEKELRTELDARKKEVSGLVEMLKEVETKYVTLRQDSDHKIAHLTSECAHTKQKLEDEKIKVVVLNKQIVEYKKSLEHMKEEYEEQISELELELQNAYDAMRMYEEDTNVIHDNWITERSARRHFEHERNAFAAIVKQQTETIHNLEGTQSLPCP
jgi:DNA repair exonuclease SbcCD ATPase subunit